VSANQEPPAEGTLLFIYAADSGLFNTVADIAHKLFSPHTYQCQLCALTHGHFKVRNEWQQFIRSLPVPCKFMHRDEIMGTSGIDVAHLPAIYRWREDHWERCMACEAIAACVSLEQLMAAIRSACG
jgi:hypothetical protein